TGKIAITPPNLKGLAHPFSRYYHSRSNTTTVAFSTFGPQNHPVIGIATIVAPKGWDIIFVDDENVDVSIIVKVTKGRPAPHFVGQFPDAGGLRDVFELLASDVTQQIVGLCKRISGIMFLQLFHGVTIGNEQIQPTVIVEIKKFGSPAAVMEANHSQTKIGGSI